MLLQVLHVRLICLTSTFPTTTTHLLFSPQAAADSVARAFAMTEVEAIVKAVFSWVILMPIAIIVAGKWLAQHMKLVSAAESLFRIPMGKIGVIEAKNDEVILGFTGFFLIFLLLAFAGGKRAYAFVVNQMGINPGHFNSLCVLSAFLLVVLALVLHGLVYLLTRKRRPAQREHAMLIQRLTRTTP